MPNLCIVCHKYQARRKGQLCNSCFGYKRPNCIEEGCPNGAISGKQYCTVHGGRALCKTEGCPNISIVGGKCRNCGAPAKLCSIKGCTNVEVNNKLCINHGAKTRLCTICNKNQPRRGGICRRCGSVDPPHERKCKICVNLFGSKRYAKTKDEYIFACSDCFYEKYPDEERPKQYRRMEKYFDKALKKDFGDNFFKNNKRIAGGESERRPDWHKVFDDYCLIIECDEKSHPTWPSGGYTEEKEKERLEIIQKDLKGLPIKIIRFTPDDCFLIDESGEFMVDIDNFNEEYKKLKESIDEIIREQ